MNDSSPRDIRKRNVYDTIFFSSYVDNLNDIIDLRHQIDDHDFRFSLDHVLKGPILLVVILFVELNEYLLQDESSFICFIVLTYVGNPTSFDDYEVSFYCFDRKSIELWQ